MIRSMIDAFTFHSPFLSVLLLFYLMHSWCILVHSTIILFDHIRDFCSTISTHFYHFDAFILHCSMMHLFCSDDDLPDTSVDRYLRLLLMIRCGLFYDRCTIQFTIHLFILLMTVPFWWWYIRYFLIYTDAFCWYILIRYSVFRWYLFIRVYILPFLFWYQYSVWYILVFHCSIHSFVIRSLRYICSMEGHYVPTVLLFIFVIVVKFFITIQFFVVRYIRWWYQNCDPISFFWWPLLHLTTFIRLTVHSFDDDPWCILLLTLTCYHSMIHIIPQYIVSDTFLHSCSIPMRCDTDVLHSTMFLMTVLITGPHRWYITFGDAIPTIPVHWYDTFRGIRYLHLWWVRCDITTIRWVFDAIVEWWRDTLFILPFYSWYIRPFGDLHFTTLFDLLTLPMILVFWWRPTWHLFCYTYGILLFHSTTMPFSPFPTPIHSRYGILLFGIRCIWHSTVDSIHSDPIPGRFTTFVDTIPFIRYSMTILYRYTTCLRCHAICSTDAVIVHSDTDYSLPFICCSDGGISTFPFYDYRSDHHPIRSTCSVDAATTVPVPDVPDAHVMFYSRIHRYIPVTILFWPDRCISLLFPFDTDTFCSHHSILLRNWHSVRYILRYHRFVHSWSTCRYHSTILPSTIVVLHSTLRFGDAGGTDAFSHCSLRWYTMIHSSPITFARSDFDLFDDTFCSFTVRLPFYLIPFHFWPLSFITTNSVVVVPRWWKYWYICSIVYCSSVFYFTFSTYCSNSDHSFHSTVTILRCYRYRHDSLFYYCSYIYIPPFLQHFDSSSPLFCILLWRYDRLFYSVLHSWLRCDAIDPHFYIYIVLCSWWLLLMIPPTTFVFVLFYHSSFYTFHWYLHIHFFVLFYYHIVDTIPFYRPILHYHWYYILVHSFIPIWCCCYIPIPHSFIPFYYIPDLRCLTITVDAILFVDDCSFVVLEISNFRWLHSDHYTAIPTRCCYKVFPIRRLPIHSPHSWPFYVLTYYAISTMPYLRCSTFYDCWRSTHHVPVDFVVVLFPTLRYVPISFYIVVYLRYTRCSV